MDFHFSCEQREMLRSQEDAQIAQEAKRQRRLRALAHEEWKYLVRNYGYPITELPEDIISKSLLTAGVFNFTIPRIVTDNMLDDRCAMCLETFQLDEGIGKWKCSANHELHLDCMWHTMRAEDKCPACQ